MKKHEDIQRLAYELFERSGRAHGRDMEHWLEAERIVRARQMDQHAADVEAAASRKRALQRSDARWHQAKKAGKGRLEK